MKHTDDKEEKEAAKKVGEQTRKQMEERRAGAESVPSADDIQKSPDEMNRAEKKDYMKKKEEDEGTADRRTARAADEHLRHSRELYPEDQQDQPTLSTVIPPADPEGDEALGEKNRKGEGLRRVEAEREAVKREMSGQTPTAAPTETTRVRSEKREEEPKHHHKKAE